MSRLVDAYDRSRVRAALLVKADCDVWLVAGAATAVVLVVGTTLLCLMLTPARAATVAPAQHGHDRMHHKWNAF